MTTDSLSAEVGEQIPESETTEIVPESTEQVEYSDVELEAMEQGWKPKDQLAEGKEFISAEEFIRRGELFSKIDVIGKELKNTKQALKMLQEHHGKVRETEFNRALTYLKAQKKEALLEGDADRIIDIDDQIAEVKAQRQVEERQEKQQVTQPDPRFVSWVEKNAWYAQDIELKTFADEVGLARQRSHPEEDPSDILKYVGERVRKAYPEKFTNPNRTRPAAVEGRATPKGAARSQDDFEMSDEEKRVMNTFIRQGVMTAEEYKAELKRVRG
jgi:hypothetical protein